MSEPRVCDKVSELPSKGDAPIFSRLFFFSIGCTFSCCIHGIIRKLSDCRKRYREMIRANKMSLTFFFFFSYCGIKSSFRKVAQYREPVPILGQPSTSTGHIFFYCRQSA